MTESNCGGIANSMMAALKPDATTSLRPLEARWAQTAVTGRAEDMTIREGTATQLKARRGIGPQSRQGEKEDGWALQDSARWSQTEAEPEQ